MQGDSHFDSSWPVALALGLLITFILAITPTGHQVTADIFNSLTSKPVEPVRPPRPEVLVATDNSDDQTRVAATVVPRGYSVLFAGTTLTAQRLLQSDADRIGLIVVGAESQEARQVTQMARSLVPAATLVELPAKHGSTEVALLLLDVI